MRIPINLNDYHEPTTAPIGKYDLIIASCEEELSKNKSKPQFRCSIGFEGHPEYQNILHFVSIPSEKDEPDTAAFKALMLKRFLVLFKQPLPTDGFDTTQLAMQLTGARGNCAVSLEHEKDEAGNDKDGGRVFNRLDVPRLKDEPSKGAVSAAQPPKR